MVTILKLMYRFQLISIFLSTTELSQLVFFTPFLLRCVPRAGQPYSPAFTHSGAYREYDDAETMAVSPMNAPITIDSVENYIVSDI